MSGLNIRGACLNTRELKFDKDKKTVQFYFVTYGKKNEYGEMFFQGSLTNALKRTSLKEIKHFKNHDRYDPAGVVRELGEDEYGAWAKCELLNTRTGTETYEQYAVEQITQHSFGFHYVDNGYKYNPELDAIIIIDFDLKEVSSLNSWGADAGTKVINLNESSLNRSEFINSIKKGESKQLNIDQILNSIKL